MSPCRGTDGTAARRATKYLEATKMLTRHGKVMSSRMERLWAFMQEQRINLNDWSTDQGVEREQAALRAGERVLVERLNAVHRRYLELTGDMDRDLANLLLDYRTIMNRRPHGRVTPESLREGEALARKARAALHAGAGEDEITSKIRGML